MKLSAEPGKTLLAVIFETIKLDQRIIRTISACLIAYILCVNQVYLVCTLCVHEHTRYTQGILKVYTRYTQGGNLTLPEYKSEHD